MTTRAFLAPILARSFGRAVLIEPGPKCIPCKLCVQAYDPCRLEEEAFVASRADMVDVDLRGEIGVKVVVSDTGEETALLITSAAVWSIYDTMEAKLGWYVIRGVS